MCAANPGFEHTAAPHGNLFRLATIVDLLRRSVSTDASELDIDDSAGAQLDGRAGVFVGVDAFVETNRSIQFSLQLRVTVQVVPAERLLDHHQVVGFETLQMRPIFKLIRGVRIDHQTNVWKALPQVLDWFDVVSRLNFNFDALIPCCQFTLKGGCELLK